MMRRCVACVGLRLHNWRGTAFASFSFGPWLWLANGFREVCLWGLCCTMRVYVRGLRGAGGMALMWNSGFGMFACKAGVVWRATVLSGSLVKGLISLMMAFFR